MQKYLFLILFCFVNIGNVFTQLNKSSHIEAGMFVCILNKYLIYIQDEEIDSEELTYKVMALNLRNNEKLLIDKQVKTKCVNISDTAILYIKGSDLILWNLDLKRKIIYYRTSKDMSLIGVSYNKYTSCLLFTQINLNTKELYVKIMNNRKQIIFCQKIKINEMEMEGVIPILDTSGNFFVLLIQDKLYAIDSKKLKLKFISNRCDGYAQNKEEIIYYKFVTDEKTEGYSISLISNENKKIDNSLNEKIYSCEKSFLFTENINNNFIPTYIICNKSYSWVNNRWQIDPDFIVYKDKYLIVKMPFEKNIIKDNCFQWELR